MYAFGFRWIEFAMRHACTCTHPLHFTRPDDGAGSHTVFVLERAFENVSNDLHISMRMGSKALCRSNGVFINDAQCAKTHVRWVVIPIERKRVIGIEPAMVKMAAVISLTHFDHD